MQLGQFQIILEHYHVQMVLMVSNPATGVAATSETTRVAATSEKSSTTGVATTSEKNAHQHCALRTADCKL